MASDPITRSRASFRFESQQARVHVYTYRYEQPSRQTRKPGRDLIVLFPDRHYNTAACFRVGDITSRVLPVGNIMLVPAQALVNAVGAGGDLRIVACSLTGGILPPDFDPYDVDQLAMCNDIADRNVEATMRRLAMEAMAPGHESLRLVDALAETLKVDVARYLRAGEVGPRGHLARWQVNRIEDHVLANLGAKLSVAELAELVQISPGHLMRSFRETTGVTVYQYILQRRMERACQLLSETQIPLKQLALDLGFANPSSFTFAFRKSTGMTPARYRAAHT